MVVRLLTAAAFVMTLLRERSLIASASVKSLTGATTVGSSSITGTTIKQPTVEERCAVNLWGLPRAFESLVLPSLIQNVILPNAAHNCDYFVHYYQLETEAPGRSGSGGAIHPEQVLQLEQHVLKHAVRARTPIIKFAVTNEADFWEQYQDLLDKIQHTKDADGKLPLYFPWRAKTYKNPDTVINVIKMWHTIQSAWNLMKQHEASQENVKYTQVAMIRSDVVYMTPVDLYEYGSDKIVVPAFGRYPVSDRLLVGPAAAVEIWATQRFLRLDKHVQYMYEHNRGLGLHSELFVWYSLFPTMQQVLLSSDNTVSNQKNVVSSGNTNQTTLPQRPNGQEDWMVQHPTLCFFRARADETVWVSDCDGKPGNRTGPHPAFAKICWLHTTMICNKLSNTCCLGRAMDPSSSASAQPSSRR